MQPRARYLIVDGHSVIFAWPELRKLHARRSSLARESLIKQLRDYQDWTGVRVVVVFDGKGKKTERLTLAKCRFSIRAVDNQPMQSSSDWQASTQNGTSYCCHFRFDGSRNRACLRRRIEISPDALRALLSSARRS